MAKKRKRAEHESDQDEFEDDEVGTQPLGTVKVAQGIHNMNDDRSQAERDLSAQEKTLKQQREEENEQREAASKEYEEKMAEAEEKIAKQYEESGEERPDDPNKPPEACEQFEGYGEFFVPQDVNIRHRDHKQGSRVALNWEDYQALRDQKIYCVPVPKLEEPSNESAPEQQPV
jgi:hypothetical protein